MTKKRDVVLVKFRDMRAKLLKQVKNIKKKTLLKLICQASLGIVIFAKMIILILWEINTLIDK